MKQSILLITTLLFSITNSFNQTKEEYTEELYPDIYTFKNAEIFEQLGEYEKAIWFNINLFPDNKPEVIESVKTIAVVLDTVNMSLFIKSSFALYATFDPEIATFKDGELSMNMEMLNKKAAWGDELILKISNSKPLSTATEYNLRSIERFKMKDYAGSVDDLNKAIEIDPTGQFYFKRGFTKTFVDDYKGAMEDFTKTIELKYRIAEAYFERAYCKEMIKDPEAAIIDYTKAIEINGVYADAYNNRGFVNYNQKNYKQSLKDFDKAIKLKPDYTGAYFSRGCVKQELGNKKGACNDWQKALDLGFSESKIYMDKYCK